MKIKLKQKQMLLLAVIFISFSSYLSEARWSGSGSRIQKFPSSLLPHSNEWSRNGSSKFPNEVLSSSSTTASPSWALIPRGGGLEEGTTTTTVSQLFVNGFQDLFKYMKGPKSDTVLLFLISALNTPICKLQKLNVSPILGYLALGVLLGPYGLNAIQDVHKTELFADIGVVLFLFEMGIHLNFQTLMKMKRDVFGFGGCQFAITASIIMVFLTQILGISASSAIVIGGGLALSSSAFVLQLLKDRQELSTQFGKSSFGVLLLQDLAVVPLLVTTQMMGSGSSSSSATGMNADTSTAILSALMKALIAVGGMAVMGGILLQTKLFDFIVRSQSQESLVGFLFATVLGMSFLTEGCGLSNTLGAFVAGVLLSNKNSQYDHIIEKEISPYRAILVGIFFFTVGFEIDIQFILNQLGPIVSIVIGIIALKTLITTGLHYYIFGNTQQKDLGLSQRIGFILSQGGEFAFVAFRLARSYDILSKESTKLLLTSVSLTMAVTPFLEQVGRTFAKQLEKPKEQEAEVVELEQLMDQQEVQLESHVGKEKVE